VAGGPRQAAGDHAGQLGAAVHDAVAGQERHREGGRRQHEKRRHQRLLVVPVTPAEAPGADQERAQHEKGLELAVEEDQCAGRRGGGQKWRQEAVDGAKQRGGGAGAVEPVVPNAVAR
jgi:hypothetical protein